MNKCLYTDIGCFRVLSFRKGLEGKGKNNSIYVW